MYRSKDHIMRNRNLRIQGNVWKEFFRPRLMVTHINLSSKIYSIYIDKCSCVEYIVSKCQFIISSYHSYQLMPWVGPIWYQCLLMMINKIEVWGNPWSVSCDKRVRFWLPASEIAAVQAGQAQSVRTCRIFYNYNQSGSGRSSQINVK